MKKSDFSSDKQLAKWDKIAKKEGIGYIDFELIRVYRRYVDLGAFSVVDHRKAQNYILAMSMTDLAFILKRNINQFESLLLAAIDNEKGQIVLKRATKTITANIQFKLENFLGARE